MTNAPKAKIANLTPLNGYITVVTTEGQSYSIRSEQNFWNAAVEAYRAQDWDRLYDIMEPKRAVEKFTLQFEDIVIENGQLTYRGKAVHNAITSRIFQFIEQGEDVLPLIKFFHRLKQNPSFRAVEETFDFLDHKNLPITEDGTFLAYKSVRPETYFDWHSNTKDYSIGNIVTEPRNEVDDNREHACSNGLHVGTLEYASTFHSGDNIVICEIDPANVVSVPTDCSCQKMRVCELKVVGQYTGPLTRPVYASRYTEDADVNESFDYEEEEDEEDYDDICDYCGEADCDGECI